ncbi:hypothetical protein GCM10027073_27360 [Streptomyces chlorus]
MGRGFACPCGVLPAVPSARGSPEEPLAPPGETPASRRGIPAEPRWTPSAHRSAFPE